MTSLLDRFFPKVNGGSTRAADRDDDEDIGDRRGGPSLTAEYPTKFDVPSLRERRYLYTTRIVTLLLMCSMMMNISLGFAIFGILPLRQPIPFLVQMAKSEDVLVNIQPITREIGGVEALSEKLVGEYVAMRNTIVRSDQMMLERWSKNGLIGQQSSDDEFARFAQQIQRALPELRKNDVTQEVQISSVSAVTKNRLYMVNFTTIARDANEQVINRQSWVATLEIAYEPIENIPSNLRTVNPTGFKVISYTVAEKGA